MANRLKWILIAAGLLVGCADTVERAPTQTALSDEHRRAGHEYASQFEELTFEACGSHPELQHVAASECALPIPDDWIQTSRTCFRWNGSQAGDSVPATVKIADYASAGTLQLAVSQFRNTAHGVIENYSEQHRWRTVLDDHPCVVIQYSHTDDADQPGKPAITRAFVTIKHDRTDRTRIRTVIVSCTASAEQFDTVAPLFNEIAGRIKLFHGGS